MARPLPYPPVSLGATGPTTNEARQNDSQSDSDSSHTLAPTQSELDSDQRASGRSSPYVELDSWIYPAIERLAALGYIHSEFLDTRPWTRIECASLIEEAREAMRTDDAVPKEVDQLYSTLREEFRRELLTLEWGIETQWSMHLESLYANATGINGRPLNDSYHFGETIINNFGRPYQQGFNSWDGLSAYANAWRFVIYVRGEFQHAPSAAAYALPVRQAIAALDGNPLQPSVPIPIVNQFTLLDTYVAARAEGWDFSFGKQSFWWGPGDGGDLIFSDNAEPIYAFRVSRVTPFSLPWIFHWLGPAKVDAFFGKLSGNEFPPRPLFHGERLSIKPTKYLEFGIARTGEFGGVGRPFTLAALWNAYFVFNQSSQNYPAYKNPGKRTGGVDFSYHVPFLRDWLTIYANSLSSDDPSPLSNPPRAAWNPGMYMPKLPGLPQVDLRLEAVNTNLPNVGNGLRVYWESFYRDLYTNDGNIMGDWVGRQALGLQAQSTYWLSARNNVQFAYRSAKVAKDFVPGGETVDDASVKFSWWLHQDVSVSASGQYEKWVAPILALSTQRNWTSTVQITLWPQFWLDK